MYKIARNGNLNPETGTRTITLYAFNAEREKRIKEKGVKELTKIIKKLSDLWSPYIMTENGKRYIYVEKNEELTITEKPLYFIEKVLLNDEELKYFFMPYYTSEYYKQYGEINYEKISNKIRYNI